VADDYSSNTSTTGSVSVGGTRSGAIEAAGDTDWFRITLTAGRTYRFDLEGLDTSRGTLPDPFLRLRDSSGASLTFNDDGGTGDNSRITWPATLSGTYYLSVGSSTTSGTGTYRVSAVDVTPANQKPTVAGQLEVTYSTNQSFKLSSLFSAVDADGSIASYQFWDSTPGAGYLTLNGVRISGTSITVPLSQLGQVGYWTGASAGWNQIAIVAVDNQGLASSDFNMRINVAAPTNKKPTIAGQPEVTFSTNQSFKPSSYFSAVDPDGTIASYTFSDSTPGAGHLTFDGVKMSGTSLTISASQLSRVGYFTGPTAGSNTIAIEAIDNKGAYSNDFELTINVGSTGNQRPAINGPLNISFPVNRQFDFTTLISSSDPDGHVVRYRFSDATPGSGELTLDGQPISVSSVTVAANQLGRIGYSTGSIPGNNKIAIEAIDDKDLASPVLELTINVTANGVRGSWYSNDETLVVAGFIEHDVSTTYDLALIIRNYFAFKNIDAVTYTIVSDRPGAGFMSYDGMTPLAVVSDSITGSALEYVTGTVTGVNELFLMAYYEDGSLAARALFMMHVGGSDMDNTSTYNVLGPNNSINASFWEGESATFLVTRPNSNSAETLYFSVVPLSASYEDGDYATKQGGKPERMEVSFGPGELQKAVSIEIRQDGVEDPEEMFRVFIESGGSDAESRSVLRYSFTHSIVDVTPEPPVTVPTYGVSAESPQVAEGGTLIFTISRPMGLAADVLYFSTVSVSASYGAGDYATEDGGRPLNVPVPFAANETSRSVFLKILADGIPDGGEQFHAIVQTAAQSALPSSEWRQNLADSDLITIVEGIVPPSDTDYTLVPSATAVSEGDMLEFTIVRQPNLPGETLYFSAASGSASFAEGDYLMENGAEPRDVPVVFQDNELEQTVRVKFLQDGMPDSGEQFHAIVQKHPPSSNVDDNVARTVLITIRDVAVDPVEPVSLGNVRPLDHSVVVEMAFLAKEVYGPNETLTHKAERLAWESGAKYEETAGVADDAEKRGWHALEANELGIHPAGGGGPEWAVIPSVPVYGADLKWSFGNGHYMAYGASVLENDTPEANALVLAGLVSGERTLAVVFRGTDQYADYSHYDNFGKHYALLRPLVDAISAYLTDPGNGIEQVFVSGHSLGASMVQYFLNEGLASGGFLREVDVRAWTFGSPGAEVVGGEDAIAFNAVHTDDVVPQSAGDLGVWFDVVGAAREFIFNDEIRGTLGPTDAYRIFTIMNGILRKERIGSDVNIVSDIKPESLVGGTEEHSMTSYIADLRKIALFANDEGSPFYSEAFARALRGETSYSGDEFRIAVGTTVAHNAAYEQVRPPLPAFLPTVTALPDDRYVLGSHQNDRFVFATPLSNTVPNIAAVIGATGMRRFDGGGGSDVVVLPEVSLTEVLGTQLGDGGIRIEWRPIFGGAISIGDFYRVENVTVVGSDGLAAIGDLVHVVAATGPSLAGVAFTVHALDDVYRGASVPPGELGVELVVLQLQPEAVYTDVGDGDFRALGTSNSDIVYLGNGSSTVEAGEGDDIVIVKEVPQAAEGPVGSNLIDGGPGSDVMVGGRGDDVYLVESPGDVVSDARGGWDTVRSSIDYELPNGVEELVLVGVTARVGIGNGLDNRIVGSEAANELYGGDGDDFLEGGAGDDFLRGGDGIDTAVFSGNRADYVIDLLAGAVTVSGPDGADVLVEIERLQFSDGVIDVPSIVQLSAELTSVFEDGSIATPFSFVISLDRVGISEQAIWWTVGESEGTSASASDFAGDILPWGSVTFAPGETSKTVMVDAAADGLVEPDESFIVTLFNPSSGLLVGTASASGTIQNDDQSIVTIEALSAVKEEGYGGPVLFTFAISLDQAGLVDESVDWAVMGTGAHEADGADFGGSLPFGTVTIAAGESNATITVEVSGDTAVEFDEDFVVSLSNPSSGLAIGTASAVGTIQNDDATVSIALSEAVRAEGSEGGLTPFTAVLTRSGDTSVSHSIAWYIAGVGAFGADPDDFAPGTLNGGIEIFAPGETTRTIIVEVVADTEVETDEVFQIGLFVPSLGLAIGGDGFAIGTIRNDDAMISIAAQSTELVEGDSSQTSFVFVMTRDGDLSAEHSVTYTVSGSGAEPATAGDFVGQALPMGSVTFAPNVAALGITIAVAGDTTVETDEDFTVTLSDPSLGLVLGTASAAVTIQNDDGAVVSISTLSAMKAEQDSGLIPFTFLVALGEASALPQSVDWAVTGTGPTPADGADFEGGVLPFGSLIFAPDETAQLITVMVAGDRAVEPDDFFVVTLSNPSNGLSVAAASAFGIVQNDDRATVSIAALSAGKAEGDAGTTPFTFTVSLDQAPVVGQSVGWSVTGSGGQPADAADFGGAMPTGTVSFAPGQTLATITVGVSGDTQVEPDETFAVTLVDLSAGLAPGTSSAIGAIDSDDSVAVSIAALSAVKPEGTGGTTAYTFTVSLSQAGLTGLTVDWSVDGSGQSPATALDFGGTSGTVSFAAGETIATVTVSVLGDNAVERDEEFTVSLSNPAAGLAIGAGAATGTIVNDDLPTVAVYAYLATKAEGSSGTTPFVFTIGLAEANFTGGQTVAWSIAGSGANPANAADFAGATSGTVTYAPGEAVRFLTIDVVGDVSAEPDEGFAMTLSNPSGLTLGDSTATGTIQNDDAGPAPAVVAHDDAYIVLEGRPLTAPVARGVLANDANASTASLLSGPGDGTAQMAGNGSFGYTPAAGFTGIDSFTYRAGNAGSSTADAQASIYVVPVNVGETTTLDLLSLSAEEQIAATYVAFFGRAADRAGFDFWVGQFVSGLPVQGPAVLFANIASSFGISDEAKALYPFLANPFGASDGQISAFLDSVYNNLFNRGSDPAGLAYWTGETKATLLAGRFVGSILVNIMSGAQDTAAGQDITTLMGKVAVSLDYVQEQHERNTGWLGSSDVAAATALLDPVTSDPLSVLTGIRNAEDLIAAHP